MSENDFMANSSQRNVIPLDLTHTQACLELDTLALKGMWNKKQWQKELSDSQRLCLGVLNGSSLIALACSWLIIDEIHLTAIAVHPSKRRTGLAKYLLLELLNRAKILGAKYATLEVSAKNSVAQTLYQNCGFKTAGRRNSYYKDGSDALIQWLKLDC